MEKNYAQFILEETRKNYNLIAEDFTRTTAFLPDEIKALENYAFAGEKVLDLGCGNGRFFEAFKDKGVDYTGADVSEELIEIAKKNHPKAKFQIIEPLVLPFPENCFDKVYSISVLHHVPSKDFRLQYLKEIKRVLKPKGLLILRVWDFWKRKSGRKIILRSVLSKISGKTWLDFFDLFLPWKDIKGEALAQRYFHCFSKGELGNLIKSAGFKIKESWRSGEGSKTNIYFAAEK